MPRALLELGARLVGDVGDHQLPALQLEGEDVGELARRDHLALRQDRHPAAEHLRIRQDVRAEEHGAAAGAQAKDQVADLAAAQRIEPRHRLVEKHHFGIVDEGLGQARALQHAFRKLPQPHAAFGAKADFIEHARHPRGDVGAGGTLAASGRLSEILAFEVRGWELVISDLRPEVLARIAPQIRKSIEISPQRYALELPLDVPPERLLTDLAATGAKLVSLNPVRDTLEDFFVRRVAEVGDGARAERGSGGSRERGSGENLEGGRARD